MLMSIKTQESTPAGSFFISLSTISVNSSGIAATIVPSLARYKGSYPISSQTPLTVSLIGINDSSNSFRA